MEDQKITFFSRFSSCTDSCFFVVFFVHQIVLFSGFLRAPNRAFLWFSSCTKSCFFVVFFVHQIVFFCGFLRAPNGALLRATVTEVRQDTKYNIFKSNRISCREFVCINLCPSKSSLCAMLRLLLTKSPSVDETGCAMVILLP